MSGDTLTQIDVTQVILETANTLCHNIIQSIDDRLYELLDKMIFLNSDLTEESPFVQIFGKSATSGVLLLANTLLFAFILYYCIRLIASHFSGAEVESPGRFFLRAILAAFLVNSSLDICRFLLEATNQLSSFFQWLGEDIFGVQISFKTLIKALSTTSSSSFSVFSLDGILTSMLSISSFALLLSFALRYILIELLILASPFAFLCATNKSTEGFLKSWYRSLLSLLLLQIILSALLLIPHALLKIDGDSLFHKILIVGSISALLKSGQLVKEFMGGIGIQTNFQAGISGIKSMIAR